MIQTIGTCLLLTALAAAADSVVNVARYGEQDLIPVRTKLRFTTVIVLPPGEEIAEVSCGDKEYWIVDGRDNILHVKPAREGATTNLNIVLRNKVVYSFLLREIGSQGSPDLKVVVGPDEVLSLRAEKKSLEDAAKASAISQKAEIAQIQEERRRADVSQKETLDQLTKGLPDRIAAFIGNQKFTYVCFQKTDICIAAIFATDARTYVVGHLGDSPVFSGSDAEGKWQPSRKFEHQESLYTLEGRLREVTISFHGRSLSFGLN